MQIEVTKDELEIIKYGMFWASKNSSCLIRKHQRIEFQELQRKIIEILDEIESGVRK